MSIIRLKHIEKDVVKPIDAADTLYRDVISFDLNHQPTLCVSGRDFIQVTPLFTLCVSKE